MGLNAFIKAPQLRRRGIPQDRSHFDGKIRPSSGENLGSTQRSSPCCLPPPTAATYSGCHTTSCTDVKTQTSKTLPQNKAWGSARACGQGAPSSQMWGRAHPPVPGDAQGWLDRKQTRRGKSKRSSSELFNTSLYCLCF